VTPASRTELNENRDNRDVSPARGMSLGNNMAALNDSVTAVSWLVTVNCSTGHFRGAHCLCNQNTDDGGNRRL
jgi:hypothetical protein